MKQTCVSFWLFYAQNAFKERNTQVYSWSFFDAVVVKVIEIVLKFVPEYPLVAGVSYKVNMMSGDNLAI